MPVGVRVEFMVKYKAKGKVMTQKQVLKAFKDTGALLELNVKCIFAEKVQGKGVDATGKPNTVLALRRFSIKKGERYVVAEDVVTKGGRVQETIDLVKAAGGKVAGVVLLVDRSGGKVKFGRIPMFSLMQMTPETWTAAECPMCKAGTKPVHPGS